MRVAMVCLGNICRSPMAAAVASALVRDAGMDGQVTVESFGTAGYHVGECADRQAESALARNGWPAGGHRARQLGPADIAAADLVLCADLANREEVRRLAPPGTDLTKIRMLRSYDPQGGERSEVPDPWGLDDAGFDRALAMIERSCRGLVAELAARTG